MIPPVQRSMGPPPDPLPQTFILQPEIDALSVCFKNAIVKAGQIYRFLVDSQKLDIKKYTPDPPQLLTNALGREAEKFDQLCDAIESQLLRAIAVLERDLAREERRIEESKTAARTSSPSSLSLTTASSSQSQADSIPSTQMLAGELSASVQLSSSVPLGRRPSIFLSSLQRPLPPPKLDLSAISHRMSAEESSLFSGGLASPVTLAPRSARPIAANELPPDLMAFASRSSDANGTIDIDLTVPDDSRTSADMDATANGVDAILDSALGNSADKPIELDLDMDTVTDLFGDSESTANDGLFSPSTTSPDVALAGQSVVVVDGQNIKKDEVIDMEMFDASRDLFATLAADSQHNINANQLDSQSNPMLMPPSGPSGTSPSAIPPPSPASLLASFGSASNMNATDLLSSQNGVPDTTFDFDLSIFSASPSQALNLEAFFNMDGQSGLDTVMGDEEGGQRP